MSILKISLEQWQAFVCVVQQDGFVNAAKKLNRTQPSITYSIQKIENLLGVSLFEIKGRKSFLTEEGKDLYLYAEKLVELAYHVELKASGKANQLKREIRLAVDEIYPLDKLMRALSEFAKVSDNVCVILSRGILSFPGDSLQNNQADLVIAYSAPANSIAEPLLQVTSAPFVSHSHPFSQITQPISKQQLAAARQIIVRDSNQQRSLTVGWLNVGNAWYVDTLEMKLQLVAAGIGYSWINQAFVDQRGLPLKQLTLKSGTIRQHLLYLAYHEKNKDCQALQLLIDLLKKQF